MKHLRKDDGYVLVYVLIVFTILSAVAVTMCTLALNNLKAQKADVLRMEARYAAEAELQKFIAQVETNVISDEEVADIETAIKSQIPSGNVFVPTVTAPWEGSKSIDVEVDKTITYETDTLVVQIATKLRIPVNVEFVEYTSETFTGSGSYETLYKYKYRVDETGVKYDSYDISYKEVSE